MSPRHPWHTRTHLVFGSGVLVGGSFVYCPRSVPVFFSSVQPTSLQLFIITIIVILVVLELRSVPVFSVQRACSCLHPLLGRTCGFVSCRRVSAQAQRRFSLSQASHSPHWVALHGSVSTVLQSVRFQSSQSVSQFSFGFSLVSLQCSSFQWSSGLR